jgi:hypothetical protein
MYVQATIVETSLPLSSLAAALAALDLAISLSFLAYSALFSVCLSNASSVGAAVTFVDGPYFPSITY